MEKKKEKRFFLNTERWNEKKKTLREEKSERNINLKRLSDNLSKSAGTIKISYKSNHFDLFSLF